MSLLSPAGSGGHESSVHALLKQSGEWDFDVIRYCDTVAMLGLWPMASLAMHCMQVRQRDTQRAERESARAPERKIHRQRVSNDRPRRQSLNNMRVLVQFRCVRS